MKKSDQAKGAILTLLVLACTAGSMEAHSERTNRTFNTDGKKFPNYIKNLDEKSFESRKFSKRFKLKGWRIGNDIYIGGVKAAGDYGPGIVLDKGRSTWGFNHQAAEIQLRF